MIRRWIAAVVLLSVVAQAKYTEYLTLRPLPRNNLLTSFEFESTSSPLPIDEFYSKDATTVDQYEHYTTFPRSLGQLIEQSNTHELHLRFSQGWWDAESWGAQPGNGTHSGGIGVEIWAWLEGNDREEAVQNWNRLVNALSGFFCASLNYLDSAHTTFPVKSFTPDGENSLSGNNLYLLRGALPREPVCTENLTPFIKLLPCKGKAGISTLLDGHKIFDAQWQGMSVDVVPQCGEDGKCAYKMTQIIDAVVDVARAVGRKSSPIPKPIPRDELRCNTSKPYYDDFKCFPLNEDTEVSWSLADMFGREINGACSLSENDHQIKFDATDSWSASLVYNQGSNIQQGDRFIIPKDRSADVKMSSTNSAKIQPITTPPVYVERSFTGYGSDRGGIRTVFTNPSSTESVRFVYFETLPWYMRLYLHTLKVDVHETSSNEEIGSLVQDLHYSPAIDRKRPSHIEIEIVIPPATALTMSYDFDKSMLYLEEYPPDANRGFDIAPGVLTTLGTNTPFTIRTTSLLLSLPTPDFSMPYNVIILTCTVMALTFGTLFNLLVKDVVTDEQAEEAAQNKPLAKIVKRLKAKIQVFKDKLEGPKRGPYPYVDNDKKKNVPE